MKTCIKCGNTKPYKFFSKEKGNKDGFRSVCKSCRNESRIRYSRTITGLVSVIYSQQKRSSKHRGHTPPKYSLEELYKWILSQDNFNLLYLEWVKSNYDTQLRPSIDRLNDNDGYNLSNIRLVTWRVNNTKSHVDMKSGAHPHPNTKKIIQLNMDGKYIKEFISIQEACRMTGAHHSNIYKVCNGIRVSTGGCKWKYK